MPTRISIHETLVTRRSVQHASKHGASAFSSIAQHLCFTGLILSLMSVDVLGAAAQEQSRVWKECFIRTFCKRSSPSSLTCLQEVSAGQHEPVHSAISALQADEFGRLSDAHPIAVGGAKELACIQAIIAGPTTGFGAAWMDGSAQGILDDTVWPMLSCFPVQMQPMSFRSATLMLAC